MSDFSRGYHNPMELIKQYWPDADTSHIEYDPNMKSADREYWRIESCGHDGTLMFTVEMFQKCLLPLLNRTTHYVSSAPDDWGKVKDIKYKIGRIRHAIVYGKVELRCGGKYPGLRERVRIPVICKYVYKD